MKTLNYFKISSLILALFAGTLGFGQNTNKQKRKNNTMEQNTNDYSSWDTNRDDQIDNDEFRDGLSNNKSFNNWDADGNSSLSEDEWNDGMTGNYDNYDSDTNGTFNDWDTNDDNVLDEDEYSDGTFNTWDEDRNGSITDTEYDTYNKNRTF